MPGTEWLTVFQTLGIPVGIMLMMAYAFKRLAEWFAPQITELLKAHRDFLTAMQTTQEKIGETIEIHDRTKMSKLDDIHGDVKVTKDGVMKLISSQTGAR